MKQFIAILSALVVLIVALLYILPKGSTNSPVIHALPVVNACINALTTMVLIIGYLAIRRKRITLHKYLMITAVLLSTLFLCCYVIYHASVEPTSFDGQGPIRYVYYFILTTHIILAAAIVPLVLTTLYRGLSKNFARHKKVAKITLPLWLYVTITGVLVYAFLAPYYG